MKKKYTSTLSPEELAIENDNTFKSIGRDPYGVEMTTKNPKNTHYIIVPVSHNTFSRVSGFAKSKKTTPTDYIAHLVESM